MKIRSGARLVCQARTGIGSFNLLNLSIPKWFVRRRAYQPPLRPASECTYGRRSTFLPAAVITSFAGLFFFLSCRRRLDQSQSRMVPSFRARSFYLLDNAEAVSPGIRPFEAKWGRRGALQGKNPSLTGRGLSTRK